jgi:hypothetical protein
MVESIRKEIERSMAVIAEGGIGDGKTRGNDMAGSVVQFALRKFV